MDKQLEIRRPVPQKHHGFSTVSKIFFGVDIFQVVVVVVFQSLMIGCGNFNAYNSPENPGMGPGRRIYMCVYMGVIVYTCFLCLFAVKQQNFLEILAFLLQNFGFVTYGLIQVYHMGYKELPLRESNITAQHSPLLRNLALTNSLTLFVLNGVFIFLSWKLYIEFGWKIYKRVRFNLALRSIYHFYQLLSCLLKMAIMYWWMYAICHSFVLLSEYQSVMYYINLASIPTSLLYAFLGYIATRREIKTLMTLFILWTLGLIGYFLYKLYGFATDTCNGCLEFDKTGKDIHDEAILHFVYLGTLNLLLLFAILGVSCKVFSNFGKGLAQYFKPDKDGRRPRLATDLYLRRISHYFEESVVSATSYESEHDELQESMTKLGYQNVILASGAPLLTSNDRVLASSMPNLVESAQKSRTFPGVKERTDEVRVNPVRCQLAAIDEDDDLTKQDMGTFAPRKNSKSNKHHKIDGKEPKTRTSEIQRNGINEWSDSAVRTSSKDSRHGVHGVNSFNSYVDDMYGDDDVFVDRSDERVSRDSGFMDSLPKAQNDIQVKLKPRKSPIVATNSKNNATDKKVSGTDDKSDGRSQTNGVKAQIQLFNGKHSS